jgi:hypothetical protein
MDAMSLYSPDIVSVEAFAPPGQSREAKGLAAVKAKGESRNADHEVHSVKVEEIAVYKVADDKIVREEFFYKA